MRVLSLTVALAAAALLAGAAPAEPSPGAAANTRTICLDVMGDVAVQSCRVLPGRLNRDSDYCGCPPDTREVETPVCARGERPQAPSEALRQTRLEASRDGSLVGDTYEGRQICTERSSRR